LSANWQRPLVVLAVEPGDEYYEHPDGTIRRSTRVTFDRESTERIRQGYACANCLEVFEEAWPVWCSFCRAPVRERQLEYFEREYGGEIEMRSNWDKEIASMNERKERSNG
jgi:hypothetical protein